MDAEHSPFMETTGGTIHLSESINVSLVVNVMIVIAIAYIIYLLYNSYKSADYDSDDCDDKNYIEDQIHQLNERQNRNLQ